MSVPPDPLKIYHIVHVDRLASIIADGYLFPDAAMTTRSDTGTTIGMSTIKQRRLGLPVGCHPGSRVGDYVPFYFCPRSIMLYLLYKGNHPEMHYREGQSLIVHLEADLERVVDWAKGEGRQWAFSLSNAGATYAEFRKDLANLGEIDWSSIGATDFRSERVKEGKQAEFLVHGFFPWKLIERIGTLNETIAPVLNALRRSKHRPSVEIRREWYY
ncbi:MAG: DUF4433 domain-containing protein [Alphaproteobacteria bacterium]|nr:DUF4433 domain-containing protein [Alphaproteobacteria bacterium]